MGKEWISLLKQVDKTCLMDKQQAKGEIKALQKELAALQQPIRAAGLPVILLLDGWSAAGVGRVIGKLISQLDPRGYQVYADTEPEPAERRRPYLWRFWNKLPGKGQIAVLDRGWYRDVTGGAGVGASLLPSIETFERQLCDDGYLVLKFFLHISRETQKERLEKLERQAATAWRANRRDWEENDHYESLLGETDALLTASSTPWAPWHVVWNEDKHDGVLRVLRTVRDAMAAALEQGAPKAQPRSQPRRLLPMPLLRQVDLSPTLAEKDYEQAMEKERKKLRRIHSALYRARIPVIIGFEGWDAAGKGGAIRRLSWALDPRGFDVIPIAAPTPEALARHYLWRFWRELPKDGHIAIFDRTWYGRVMVERIEGLTPPQRCDMAYEEINDFEAELVRWGAVVLKFWLHIDQDTQLARFQDRQNTPEKQYKITDEDWRNREKWPAYEKAVDEMLKKTSTKSAPWIIVEGNDKRYARLKVLRTVRHALEERL